jgi:ethanolaminephosphotransferase
VVYGRWAHLVITSICDYLGINCLTIPRKTGEKNVKSSGAANGAHPEKGRVD